MSLLQEVKDQIIRQMQTSLESQSVGCDVMIGLEGGSRTGNFILFPALLFMSVIILYYLSVVCVFRKRRKESILREIMSFNCVLTVKSDSNMTPVSF